MSAETWAAFAGILGGAAGASAVVATVILGRKANTAATHSARSAAESAAAAKKANKLATKADQRADRAEARTTARNDVRLRTEVGPNLWLAVYNDGMDTAQDTIVSIRLNEQLLHIGVEEVTYLQGKGVLDLAVHFDLMDEAARVRREAQDRHNASDGAVVFLGSTSPQPVTFTERLSWRDEAGTWHTTDETERTVSRFKPST